MAIIDPLSSILDFREFSPSLEKHVLSAVEGRGRGDFPSVKRAASRGALVQALSSAVLLLLLLGLPSPSLAQTPPKVTVAYSAVSPIFTGVWMAKEIGAFEKQGLKSELVYISSGSITVQAMVGGNLDMSIAASNAVVSAILRGAPLVAVGSITNRPAMSLFVQPEITKPEQLQGKTLANHAARLVDSFLDLVCAREARLARQGQDPTDGWHARSRCGNPNRDGSGRCAQHEARTENAHARRSAGSRHSFLNGSHRREAGLLQELAENGRGDAQRLYRRRRGAENQKRVCLQSIGKIYAGRE